MCSLSLVLCDDGCCFKKSYFVARRGIWKLKQIYFVLFYLIVLKVFRSNFSQLTLLDCLSLFFALPTFSLSLSLFSLFLFSISLLVSLSLCCLTLSPYLDIIIISVFVDIRLALSFSLSLFFLSLFFYL